MTAAGEIDKSVCPKCGAAAAGKFCSDCGATLGGSACAGCGVELIEGARYCHRCGLPVGVAPPATERKTGSAAPALRSEATNGSLPWIVAAIALLAFIALIAGQKFGANRPSAAPADAVVAGDPAALGRAPDISQLTPADRAIRLHDRVLRLRQAGKQDSVLMFAPMAIAAFEMLGNLDHDSRYDLGTIGVVSENAALARAQADTILAANPNHLLGLLLAAHAAGMENRAADERRFYQRLIAAEPAERAKGLAEYLTHENDIVAALDEARRVVRR